MKFQCIRYVLGWDFHLAPGRIFYTIVNFAAIAFAAVSSSVLVTKMTMPVHSTQINSIKAIIDDGFSLVVDQFAFEKMSQQTWVNTSHQ